MGFLEVSESVSWLLSQYTVINMYGNCSMIMLSRMTDLTFQMKKYREWEADVMKEVPNWDSNGNVYKTKSFVQPALSEFVYNR